MMMGGLDVRSSNSTMYRRDRSELLIAAASANFMFLYAKELR